ncbi:MAG: metallophosphoesterase [Nannocystaceae bacterium]
MRWVVGDIQGCAVELELLLKAIRFDPASDELWAAGDLINRGPASLATLEIWHDIGGLAVLGNHEVYALSVHAGRWPRKRDTLSELFASDQADTWFAVVGRFPALQHLPNDREGQSSAWLVHAGIHPAWTDLHATAKRINEAKRDVRWFESDEVRFATRVRGCTREGERSRFSGPPEAIDAPYRPWDEFYRGVDTIVHGHWASRGYHRTQRVIGLDSGCVYGGRLTAWCQDEDRIVSVASRQPRR